MGEIIVKRKNGVLDLDKIISDRNKGNWVSDILNNKYIQQFLYALTVKLLSENNFKKKNMTFEEMLDELEGKKEVL